MVEYFLKNQTKELLIIYGKYLEEQIMTYPKEFLKRRLFTYKKIRKCTFTKLLRKNLC